MAIVDLKDAFLTTVGSESLSCATTTAVTSDYKFPMPNRNDDFTPKYVEFLYVSGTPGVGTDFTFSYQHSDDSTEGNFVAALSTSVVIANIKAGFSLKMPLPQGLKAYQRVKITPAASMTGTTVFKARLVHG